MAHEVISNGRPDICKIDPAMPKAAADEVRSTEQARSGREQFADETFIGTVHEVICNGRPGRDDLDLDSERLDAAIAEFRMAENERDRRERYVRESFFEAVLLPALRRAREAFSDGFQQGRERFLSGK